MKNSSKEFYKKYKKRYEKNEKLRKGTKSRIPKKGIITAAIVGGGLCALFLTLNFWSYKEDKTVKEDDKARINTIFGIPAVAMETKDGTLFNKLTAVKSGDFALMEEPLSLTPLDDDMNQTIRIFLSAEQINNISYEIMNYHNGDIIDTTDHVQVTEGNGYSKAVLEIKNLLEPKQEYSLMIRVDTKELGTLIYNTKIVSKGETQIDETVGLVNDFTGKLYKESTAEVEEYLMPASNENDKNYSNANIYTPVEAVTWKRFSPSLKEAFIPTILSIDDNNATIVQSYPVILDDDGLKRRIITNEAYTVTKGMDGQQYLTYYERKAFETITESSINFTSVGFRLGFSVNREEDLTVSQNENYAVFINGGNLWSVCNGTGTQEDGANVSKVTRVYGFESNLFGVTDTASGITVSEEGEPEEILTNYGYDIKKTDNNGNITFAVYGMFPTGKHIGKSGVALYQYSENDKTLTEKVFLSIDKEKDELEDIAQNSYLSSDGYFYVKSDGVVKINTTTTETEKIVDNCEADSVYFSKSGNYYTYKEKSGSNKSSNVLHICNAETGEKKDAVSDENTSIYSLGFIGENVVAGIKSDSGDYYSQLWILDKDGNKKSVYQKDNLAIGDVKVSDSEAKFNLYSQNGNEYELSGSDKIIGSSVESGGSNVYTTVMQDPTLGNQLWVVFKKGVVKSSDCQPTIIEEYTYAKEKEIDL